MKKILLIIPFMAVAGRVERTNTVVQQAKFRGDLKKFSVSTYQYKSIFNNLDYNLGTVAYADYFTKDVENLEDYAVVQYIRGCHFNSKIDKDGVESYSIRRARESFGQMIPYKHKDWDIDSVDLDPVYNSIEDVRHGNYRWNHRSGYSSKTEAYYLQKYPTNPRLYVRDMPGTAFVVSATEAENISLEFDMCIFKTKDVPLVATAKTDIRDKAIKCFKWSSSFIYNFKAKKFSSSKTVHPFCLK